MVSSGEGQVFDQAAFAPAPPTSFHIICPPLTQYLAMMANKDDLYNTGWVQQILVLPNIVEKLEFYHKLRIVNR